MTEAAPILIEKTDDNGSFAQGRAPEHWSDCAAHNEPAYPNGPCNCGGYTSAPAARWFWAVDKSDQPTALRVGGSGDIVISAQADIGDYGLSVNPWMDVADEHLALIAAAPALLEALLTVRDYVTDAIANAEDPMISVELSMRKMMTDDLARIDAAIAQAQQVTYD